MIADFCICHRCRWHRWQTLRCEYLREFSKKFDTTPMVYSGAWGKLIHEKNQKSKISWHCPFNFILYGPSPMMLIFLCTFSHSAYFHFVHSPVVLKKIRRRRKKMPLKRDWLGQRTISCYWPSKREFLNNSNI